MDNMNIFSKNIFTIVISGIFCLGTITPVLAQKQKKAVASGLHRRQAEITHKQFERIHSSGRKTNTTTTLNREKTPLAVRPEPNQQTAPYRTRSASKSKNLPNDKQKVSLIDGSTLRISLRNENPLVPSPVALPHNPKVNVSTAILHPGYIVKLPNGQTVKLLSSIRQNKENIENQIG
jgi:hypothetical protein